MRDATTNNQGTKAMTDRRYTLIVLAQAFRARGRARAGWVSLQEMITDIGQKDVTVREWDDSATDGQFKSLMHAVNRRLSEISAIIGTEQ